MPGFDDFEGSRVGFHPIGQPFDDGFGHYGDGIAGGETPADVLSFQIQGDTDSSPANMPQTLQFSTTSNTNEIDLWYAFRGQDATATDWAPFAGTVTSGGDAGNMSVTTGGAGVAPTVGGPGPFTDSAYKTVSFASGGVNTQPASAVAHYYYADTASKYDIGGTDVDLIVEVVFRPTAAVPGGILGTADRQAGSPFGVGGWMLGHHGNNLYYWTILGSGVQIITNDTHDLNAWEHVIYVINGASIGTQSSQTRLYKNGSFIHAIDNAVNIDAGQLTFSIGATGYDDASGFTGGFDVAWVAGWKATSWLGDPGNYATELNSWVKERHALLTGVAATDSTNATIVPTTATRASPAYLRNIDSGGRQKFDKVGHNWMRREEQYSKFLERTQGVRIEGSQTNQLLQSNNLAATWTLNAVSTSGTATSPFQGETLAGLVVDNTNANHWFFQSITLGATGLDDVVVSCVVKLVNGKSTWFSMTCNHVSGGASGFFNLQTGEVSANAPFGVVFKQAGVEFIADDTYRIWGVLPTTDADTQNVIFQACEDDQTSPPTFTGDNTVWYYVGHMMMTGAGVGRLTSWIDTTTGTVTKAADSLKYSTGITFPTSKATISADICHPDSGLVVAESYLVSMTDGGTDSAELWVENGASGQPGVAAKLVDGSGTVFDLADNTVDVQTGNIVNLGTTWTTGKGAAYTNQVEEADQDGITPNPTFTSLDIGVDASGANHANQLISNLRIWNFLNTAGFNTGGINVARGSYYWENNSTANTTPTSPAKVAGTTTAGTLSDFTHSNNRLTYSGADTKTFIFHCAISIEKTGAGDLGVLYLYKNDTYVTGSRINREISNNDEGAVPLVWNVTLANGDYVELWVSTATGNTTVTYGSIVAEEA